jgi:hypothetical protein
MLFSFSGAFFTAVVVVVAVVAVVVTIRWVLPNVEVGSFLMVLVALRESELLNRFVLSTPTALLAPASLIVAANALLVDFGTTCLVAVGLRVLVDFNFVGGSSFSIQLNFERESVSPAGKPIAVGVAVLFATVEVVVEGIEGGGGAVAVEKIFLTGEGDTGAAVVVVVVVVVVVAGWAVGLEERFPDCDKLF